MNHRSHNPFILLPKLLQRKVNALQRMPEKARMVVFCVMFIFMLAPLHVLAQGPICSYTDETSGVKYDFTKLSTSDFSTTAGGYTYNLRVCGTSEQKCPNDPDQITTGMAVQTKNTGGFGSNAAARPI